MGSGTLENEDIAFSHLEGIRFQVKSIDTWGTLGKLKVRFEVFTAVTMKNGVFWVVTPCGSYVGC
jgi:hypothetical protein